MTKDLSQLSEADLETMIANAQRALAQKEADRKKDVVTEIRWLAASVGVAVEIIDAGEAKSTRQGSKVAVKYRNPNNPNEQWTGRGIRPKWLVRLLEEGRRIEEFLV